MELHTKIIALALTSLFFVLALSLNALGTGLLAG
jgi:hypothetical protein